VIKAGALIHHFDVMNKEIIARDLHGRRRRRLTRRCSTVQIALDKVSYEIDLSAANAAGLREKLARFVVAGVGASHRDEPSFQVRVCAL